MNLKDILDGLGGLYTATGEDWELSLHHCLTEPTCPTAVIAPEGWRISRYRVDANSIEESLTTVVALVRAEILERRVVGHYAPFTNPDDDAFAKWLFARAAGSDEKLPDVPCRELPEAFAWIVDGFLKDNLEHIDQNAESPAFWSSYIVARCSRYLPGRIRLDHEGAQKLVAARLEAARAAGPLTSALSTEAK